MNQPPQWGGSGAYPPAPPWQYPPTPQASTPPAERGPFPPVWTVLTLVVAICALALAFAPPPAGWVGGAAGVVGILIAIIGLVSKRPRERSPLPERVAVGLSVLAVAAAIGMSFIYGDRGPEHGAGFEIDLDSSEIATTGLKVTVTNTLDRPGSLFFAIGAYEGDSLHQLRARADLIVLAPGAHQQTILFAPGPCCPDLAHATFRVIGTTWVPEVQP